VPQAVWTGSLSFGLVSIPVRLVNATSPRDVRFHQYEAGTGRRIRHRRVANEAPAVEWPAEADQPTPPPPEMPEGVVPLRPERPPEASPVPDAARAPVEEPPEVPYERVVKGYEVEPGRVVMVSPEELRTLEPERTGRIDIEGFVPLEQIDPVYFEKSYLVVPRSGVGVDKAYWLLHRAMDGAGRVAVARFVLRTREHLAAIRPAPGALALETLFHADEVRTPGSLALPEPAEVSAREVQVAERLIGALAMDWDPSGFRDPYRERVLQLLRERAGEALEIEPEAVGAPAGPAAPDLMEALKASLEAVKRERRRGSRRDRRG
jgi:DNA end-binding protein Ku